MKTRWCRSMIWGSNVSLSVLLSWMILLTRSSRSLALASSPFTTSFLAKRTSRQRLYSVSTYPSRDNVVLCCNPSFYSTWKSSFTRARLQDGLSMYPIRILRGGGGTSWITSSVLSSSTSSFTEMDHETSMDDETRALQESMSIVGSNILPATFGSTLESLSSIHNTTFASVNLTNPCSTISYYNTARLNQFRVLFILGGPGSGKGTQCERLTEYYPFCHHLSVGDLLRAEQDRMDSPHRDLIQKSLMSGSIVPVEISLALLQRAMEELSLLYGPSLVYLVDGFPRNFDNLQGWNKCMKGITSVWGVIMFTCPLEVLKQRILIRGQTSGRSDDNLKSIEKRFQTFADQTVPVVDVLRRVQVIQQQQQREQLDPVDANIHPTTGMPIQVMDIQGDATVEKVWSNVQTVMNQFLANDVWTANAQLMQAVETKDMNLYRSLCAYVGEKEDMAQYEDIADGAVPLYYNPSIRFETGTIAVTSYDRLIQGQMVVEERVWSHDATRGWVNVHFTRTPKK